MLETNKLYLGDCIDVMHEIPDESIDLVLTDPPYLQQYKSNLRKQTDFTKEIMGEDGLIATGKHLFTSEIEGDGTDNYKLIEDYTRECQRIMKPDTAMYMFCSSVKVDFFKQTLEKHFNVKNMIIWDKGQQTAGDLKYAFGRQYEIIFLVNKGNSTLRGKRISDVWRKCDDDEKFKRVPVKDQKHQNEKPVNLLKRCIEYNSDSGDLVFDGFAGSGNTGLAAQVLERDFILIEKDPEIYKLAEKRLKSTGEVASRREKYFGK